MGIVGGLISVCMMAGVGGGRAVILRSHKNVYVFSAYVFSVYVFRKLSSGHIKRTFSAKRMRKKRIRKRRIRFLCDHSTFCTEKIAISMVLLEWFKIKIKIF